MAMTLDQSWKALRKQTLLKSNPRGKNALVSAFTVASFFTLFQRTWAPKKPKVFSLNFIQQTCWACICQNPSIIRTWTQVGWGMDGKKRDSRMTLSWWLHSWSLKWAWKNHTNSWVQYKPMNIDIIIKLSLGHRGGKNPPQLGRLQKASWQDAIFIDCWKMKRI